MSISDLFRISQLASFDTATVTPPSYYDRRVLSPSKSQLYTVSGINSSTTVTMTPYYAADQSATQSSSAAKVWARNIAGPFVDTVAAYYDDKIVSNLKQIHVYLKREYPSFYKTAGLVRRGGGKASAAAKKINKKSGSSSNAALLQRLQVGMYFGVWYALNVIYNS